MVGETGKNREVDSYRGNDLLMGFEDAYDSFIMLHKGKRDGAAVERIKDGLSHAEMTFAKNVWWPAFHTFDALHPEYQIRDFKDGCRYIDFAYIQPHFRLAIEIDGMGPHWSEISQEKFCDHCQRQNHLLIDGWHVLRFAYMDVCERPRLCQQTIQQIIGRLVSDPSGVLQTLHIAEREIVRLALGLSRPITVSDVATHLHLADRTAARRMKSLTESGWLEPATGSVRIRSYRIHPSRSNIQL